MKRQLIDVYKLNILGAFFDRRSNLTVYQTLSFIFKALIKYSLSVFIYERVTKDVALTRPE